MSFTQEPANTELTAPSPCDVSRRSFLKLVIAAGGTAAAASALPSTAAAAETPTAYPEKLTFAVMSDVHYLSPDLIAKNASYEIAENSDRKMFSESADILDRALDVVVEQAPDMVIVPGDLTKDGEYLCHEQVADRYRRAQEAIFEATGKQTKFYVINGNHDLNNHHAKDFASAGAEDTVAPDAQRTNPTEYKTDIWADFGYPEATAFFDKDGTRDGSLSYVVRPCPGLTLIVVDSCSYNLDGGDGTLAQETQDGMTQELLDWVCAQAKAAKAAGNVVVAMQHHGIVEHFGYEDEIFGEYLVNKNLSYTAVAEAYADAGISAVFTGHMHANDIAAHTSAAGNTVYDIETGSLVTYPSYMRTGSFEFMQKGDELECTLTVDSKPLDTVSFDLASQNGLVEVPSADITAYGKERTLTVESVQTMLGSMFVEPLLTQYAPMGIKGILASLLPMVSDQFAGVTEATLGESLWTLISSLLPHSQAEGISLPVSSFNFSIWFDVENGNLMLDRVAQTSRSAVKLSLAPEVEAELAAELSNAAIKQPRLGEGTCAYGNKESFLAFFNELASSIDANLLSEAGISSLLDLISALIEALITFSIDGTHSLLDLVDFAYQDHLLGNETCPDWAATAIANVALTGTDAGGAPINTDGSLIGIVRSVLTNAVTDNPEVDDDLCDQLTTLLATVPINLKTLLIKGAPEGGTSDSLASLVYGVLCMFVSNGGNLVSYLADLVNSIPNIPSLASLAHDALYYLVNDENVNGASADETDHHLVAKATATIPVEEKPSKNELQDTIGSAEKVETAGASSSAVQEFEAALAAAQAVMNDPDATEAEISAAQARLANAIRAVQESKAQGGSGQGGNDGSSSADKPNGSELVGTGDASMAASLAALLAGSGTIAAGIWARMTDRSNQE